MTQPRSDSVVREGFGRRASIAVLFAIALAIGLLIATAEGPDAVSGGLGGDYPSFYAAGDVWLDDPGLAPEELYEPERQFEAQEPVLPSDADGNLYFAYPAFFLAPFIPLAGLSFTLSYLLNVVVMAGCVVAALFVLRPCSATLGRHLPEALAVSLTFFPLFRGVTGGQNTAFSLLLFAVVWRSLHDGRQLPAGLAAGLLLFKPPLALPIIGGLLLARRYRAVAAALGTAVALYLAGAALTGPAWPTAWMDSVRYLDRVDTPFNVHNFVSIPGVAEAIFGIDSTAAAVVGWGLAAAVAVVVAWAWFRWTPDPAILVPLTAAGALLISPHALYYDAGLLVLVGLLIADGDVGGRRWLPFLWVFGFSHVAAEALGTSPLVLLAVAGFVLVAHRASSVGVGSSPAQELDPDPAARR
jgi:hypothetical protein